MREQAFLKSSQRPWRLYWFLGFLVACAFMGGSSRPDTPILVILRPLNVLCLAVLLLMPGRCDWRAVRPLLIMLALFALTMAVQLIPLPPSVWLQLPGHALFRDGYVSAGTPVPWRPISLDPDLTLNSIVALLPALTTIVAFAGIRAEDRARVALWVIGLAVFSAALGLFQLIDGTDSPAYPYFYSSHFLPLGLLANQNHQAVFLAISLPMLAVWALRGTGSGRDQARLIGAGALSLFLLPMILATGSRSGTALGFVGPIAAILLFWRMPARIGQRTVIAIRLGVLATGAGIVAITAIFGRATSFERMIGLGDVIAERRLASTPTLLRITTDYLPFGIGYGAFDPVFRRYETDAMLQPTYFNRAHNDPLEVVMSGGVPALAVLLLFLGWFGWRATKAWQSRPGTAPAIAQARLASVVLLILMVASLTDYPMRTPLISVIFTIGCCWLCDWNGSGRRTVHEGAEAPAERRKPLPFPKR